MKVVVAAATRTGTCITMMTGAQRKPMRRMIREAGLKPRQLPVSAILAKRKAELLKVIPAWDSAENSGIFAENFFPDHPIDLLKKNYAELWAKAGKIVTVREMIPENGLRGRFIIEAENLNIEVYFTLSPENPPLIQELRAREVPKSRN